MPPYYFILIYWASVWCFRVVGGFGVCCSVVSLWAIICCHPAELSPRAEQNVSPRRPSRLGGAPPLYADSFPPSSSPSPCSPFCLALPSYQALAIKCRDALRRLASLGRGLRPLQLIGVKALYPFLKLFLYMFFFYFFFFWGLNKNV